MEILAVSAMSVKQLLVTVDAKTWKDLPLASELDRNGRMAIGACNLDGSKVFQARQRTIRNCHGFFLDFDLTFCFVSRPVRCGSTLSIAFIASSNDNGWSEIGFAFGMASPPMASASAHSSPHILAAHALLAAWSATCYDRVKDVRILAVIVSKREFRQIQRQIGLAHVVERAHDATLQQAPEAVYIAVWTFPRTYSPCSWFTAACGN
jgi:hypothetical protein